MAGGRLGLEATVGHQDDFILRVQKPPGECREHIAGDGEAAGYMGPQVGGDTARINHYRLFDQSIEVIGTEHCWCKHTGSGGAAVQVQLFHVAEIGRLLVVLRHFFRDEFFAVIDL